MVFPCYVLKGIEWSLHASSALVSVSLLARALQLLRNEMNYFGKFELLQKLCVERPSNF